MERLSREGGGVLSLEYGYDTPQKKVIISDFGKSNCSLTSSFGVIAHM